MDVRRGVGWRTAAIAIGIAWAIACTPFGAGSDDATEIVPPDADAGGTGDGSVTTPDGAAPLDASGTFCTREPFTLCADFDGPPVGEWGQPDRLFDRKDVAGGTLVVDEAGGREGLGVRSLLPAGAAGGRMARELRIDGSADVSIAADVLVKKPTGYTQGGVTVLSIVLGTEAGTPVVEAKIVPKDNGSAAVVMYARRAANDSKYLDPGASSQLIPYDTWVRIRIEARLVGTNAGAGSARITTDRGLDLVAPFTRAVALGNALTRAMVGLQRYSPAVTDAALEVHYDNVVGELLPP